MSFNETKIAAVHSFVSSDSIAASYQSIGQYRTEILKLLNEKPEPAPKVAPVFVSERKDYAEGGSSASGKHMSC